MTTSEGGRGGQQKKMEKSTEKYKHVFHEREIPRWTGIAAAFSYILALLQDKSDKKHFVREGQIDITTPSDQYDVPDCPEILKMQSTNTDDKPNGNDIIWAAHSLLISKLSKGDIKCQGQLQETFRVAITSCNPPHEYYKGKDEIDPPSDFMVVNQAEWQKEPIIDYKRQCFTKWQENPGDIDEYGDPDSNAAFFVNGCSPGDTFCWKIDCINLQVNSEDLIRSTGKLFDEYCNRNKQRMVDHDSWSMKMESTGKNRLYFSKTINSWVVEFNNGEPFQLYHEQPNSKKAKTIQYLLKNGAKSVEAATKWCNWFFLDTMKAVQIDPPEKMPHAKEFEEKGFEEHDAKNISVQNMPLGGYDSLSKEDIKIFRNQISILEQKIQNTKKSQRKKKFKEDLKFLKKHYLSNFFKGDLKTIDNELDRVKKRVRKRRDDFKKDLRGFFVVKDDNGKEVEIPGPHRDFYYHLANNIKNIDVGFAYMCNKKWITEEPQA